ncbi:hypothetical protein [Natronolimnobius baerhuensis]|uniref:Uncharacterized protein n=1 Tax=Natronolimnobius baerhuensis TaxID=253108 RepID=A0A202EB54_9EURY|nr:hypothetical protein [Natronolimnobius baerhuensis]OVE85464.1 hypothetical protein B2G88_01145 [Natronolimnobius baerhuensis]
MSEIGTTILALGLIGAIIVLPPTTAVYYNARRKRLSTALHWAVAMGLSTCLAVVAFGLEFYLGLAGPLIVGSLYLYRTRSVERPRSREERANEKHDGDYEHKHSWYR